MTKKKLITLLFVFAFAIGGFLTFAHASLAAPTYVPGALLTQNASNVNVLIKNIITFVFALTGLVVLAFIIFAGFKYMASGGDSGKKEEAQKQIVAAVIGLLIVVFSFFIVNLIFSFLGVTPGNIAPPCGVGQTPAKDGCLGDSVSSSPATN